MEQPVCDLVVLTWNRVDLLRPCVERLLAHTRPPSRLIVVDNGSTDAETLQYLRALKGTDLIETMVVRHPANVSIATALNSGLAQTRAPWICLLNNDVLVSAGWLEELIAVAESDPSIGLVNPMSNQFGLAPRPHQTIDALAEYGRRARGRWIEHAICEGFCMFFSRRVLDTVGVFDEGLGSMYFEDADYTQRAHRAGFRSVIAEGAYVYHVGGATTRHDPTRDERFAESAAQFYRKWQMTHPQRIGWVLPVGRARGIEHVTGDIRALANAGHKVWVFAAGDARRAIPRHLQVVPVGLPQLGWSAGVLWRVLTKKKRFDRLLLPEGRLAGVLERLSPVHHAAIERLAPSHHVGAGLARGTALPGTPASGRAAREQLTVLLLTKNEEAKLARCLESVRWADEVVVVDGQSTDRTRDIARQYGATVIERPFSGSFAEERNAGLAAATGDWVLQMDADEQVSPGLRAAIERLLREGSPHAALKLRRRNEFLGREMRYGGWYHYHTALFRRPLARYEGLVHERLQIQGTLGVLEADLCHAPFQSIAQFIDRQNRYTSLQASELLTRHGRLPLPHVMRKLWARPLKLFIKFYLKKQGCREGMHGLVFSLLFAWVDFLIWAKYWELAWASSEDTGPTDG